MNRLVRVMLLASVLVLALHTASPAAPPPDVIPDHYIVVFHDDLPNPHAHAQDLARRHGLGVSHVYENALKGFAARIPAAAIAGGKNCSTGRSYQDGDGHGTHVAGTIGARANDTGVVGVAPGVTLWAVRVLNNNGSGRGRAGAWRVGLRALES